MRTLVPFYIYINHPNVFLTYGGSSATIVVGVAGFQGSANLWTGYYQVRQEVLEQKCIGWRQINIII